ncbi:MAG TPA: hypothetical protein VE262_15820 [Blastocatellia bacterium]|nr:hypothetical protein [Blastocatellia bacterium]
MMTNRERLEAGRVISPGANLSPEAEAAIDNMTDEQVEDLIAAVTGMRQSIADVGVPAAIIHHHPI